MKKVEGLAPRGIKACFDSLVIRIIPDSGTVPFENKIKPYLMPYLPNVTGKTIKVSKIDKDFLIKRKKM